MKRLVLLLLIVVAACSGATDTSDDPQAVVAAHFDAINAFDAEAAITLFAPDATFSNSFYGAVSRESIDEGIIWAAAQGTTYMEPDCAVADAEDSISQEADHPTVTIVCETANLDAPSKAVGGPAVPVVMTFVVSADGIESVAYRWGSPSFRFVTNPFESWVDKHHPEDSESVGHSEWDSADGARRNGLLTAKYATEWANYLQANGCTFPDACWRQP